MSMPGRLADALPKGAKQRLLNTIFGAYGQLARTRGPYQNLFVLIHVRSGSSLLAMILGNSPEICGYGETMLSYKGPRDLDLLAGNNLYRLQPFSLPGSERYMLDKLVHDDLLAPDRVRMLFEAGSKFIFLMREPEGTIKSMVKMVEMDETLAAVVYIRRLETLRQYGLNLPETGDAFLLSHDDLVRRTESTLASLSLFLELPVPLSSDYEVLRPMRRRTRAHYEKLHLGSVDGRVRVSPDLNLPERTLRAAQDARDRCWSALSEKCVTVAR
jgi:hypothetical protein